MNTATSGKSVWPVENAGIDNLTGAAPSPDFAGQSQFNGADSTIS
jgi:hypothetical protein